MHKQLEEKRRLVRTMAALVGQDSIPVWARVEGRMARRAELRRLTDWAISFGIQIPFGKRVRRRNAKAERTETRLEQNAARYLAEESSCEYEDAVTFHPLPRKFRKHPRQRAKA